MCKKQTKAKIFIVAITVTGCGAVEAEIETRPSRQGEDVLYVFVPDVKVLPNIDDTKVKQWVETEFGFDLGIRQKVKDPERIQIVANAKNPESTNLSRIWFTERWSLTLLTAEGRQVARTDKGEWLLEAFEWEHQMLDIGEEAQIRKRGVNRVFWFELGEVFQVTDPGKYRLVAKGRIIEDVDESDTWQLRVKQLPCVEAWITVDEDLIKRIEKEQRKN